MAGDLAKTGRRLKVALVQLLVGKIKNDNLTRAVDQVKLAHDRCMEMVVLPECFNSPYGTKYFKEYAEEIPGGQTSKTMSDVSSRYKMCVVAGSIPEIDNGKIYNTCTVWDPDGKLIAKYRKAHLFDIDIPGKMTFKESTILSPGQQLTSFVYRGIRIGLGICYDIRFEELARIYTHRGCEFLIYPGAFNMTTGPKHWELLSRARANDNQLYVAVVSPARVEDSDYVAWGHTSLVDPWAEVVEQLDGKPGVLYTELNMDKVIEVRQQIPVTYQRRKDLYETELKGKIVL